ncbi:MAG: aminotransferase class V-fold PLP-dependent enzyme, partial [Gammaproteobacteria bacterium]|nr:aminotransferase class V-fold PLP-dependent enzyme [Gammaproteobacteria bacterium]
MNRKFNFCAGPAALPQAVLERAQQEMLDWHGKGLSVMEMSHRSSEFVEIAEGAEQNLRQLMNISDDFAVLFLQGGATQQFAAVPLNLLGGKRSANYVNTGQWSKKAIKEAGKYCDVNVVASSEAQNFASIPAFESWN